MTIYHNSPFDGADGTFPPNWTIDTKSPTNSCELFSNKLRFITGGDTGLLITRIYTEDIISPGNSDWSLTCKFSIINLNTANTNNSPFFMLVPLDGGNNIGIGITSTLSSIEFKIIFESEEFSHSTSDTSGIFRIDRVGENFIVGYVKDDTFQWNSGAPLSFSYESHTIDSIHLSSLLATTHPSFTCTIDADVLLLESISASLFWTNFSLHKETVDEAGKLIKQATETLVPAVGGQTYIPPTEYVPPQTVVEYKTEKTCKKVG